MRRLFVVLFAILLLVGRGPLAPSADGLPGPEETFLKQSGVPTDTEALLQWLDKQKSLRTDADHIDKLVRQLGSDKFELREKAAEELPLVGSAAQERLQKALNDPDTEVRRRAKEILDKLEQSELRPKSDVSLAIVRLVLRRVPANAVPALLGYLPSVTDPVVEEAIWFGLDSLTVRAGKLDPALIKALKDETAARRALAGCLVSRLGDREQKLLARELLADPNEIVRLRTAQGLLAAHDKAAVGVLIRLLESPAIDVAWQAEELLVWVAGDGGPAASVGAASEEERKKAHAAWDAWWQQAEGKTDLAKLDHGSRRPGLTLVCDLTGGRDSEIGSVWLCGCNGKARWRLTNLRDPQDAVLLAGNRIAIALRYGPPRIVVRELTGKQVWQKEIPGFLDIGLRRLPGGIFYLHTSHMGELSLDGREMMGRQRSEEKAVEAKSFLYGTEPVYKYKDKIYSPDAIEGPAEMLAGGEQIVGHDFNALVAVDADGKVLFELNGAGLRRPAWLPDGNVLTFSGRDESRAIVELDRNGKRLWEAVTEGEVQRLRPCLPLVRLGFTRK